MSHIVSVKKLLSDELKSLIKQLTGFKEDSAEFKKCEENSWSTIIDRYYPSVNEHRVKSMINDFVHKFKVHGFPQKAQNLSLLIDAYCKLPYFKEFCGPEVQWGLIDFLIKLSQKPTSSLKDDPPLDLPKQIVKEEKSFDWGAYLKEGYEKFRLPSEDEKSLSDWSDDEEENDEKGEDYIVPALQNALQDNDRHITLLPPPPARNLKHEAKERSLVAADWLKTFTHGLWWNNEVFREIPESKHPEANFCLKWEKITNSSPDTRILSEYKVVRELIYVLARPADCYFIKEGPRNSFKVIAKTSISSLSPMVFAATIEENFCKYMPHIRKLQCFCSEMNSMEVPSCVPATYQSYASAVQKILNQFYKDLLKFEKTVDTQESTVTMFHLLNEFSPSLNQIYYLSKLHEEAIPQDWKERDVRTNAFSLLCRLYDELRHPKKWNYGNIEWPSQKLLILFIESFYPFLKFLARYMTGYPHNFMHDEFFLSSSGEILVKFQNLESREFWGPVLTTASAAITSCSFLIQLGKQSSFFDSDYVPDILFVKVVEKISEMLFNEPLEMSDMDSERKIDDYSFKTNEWPGLFDGSLWDHVFRDVVAVPHSNLFKPTVCDRFSKRVSETNLYSYGVTITFRNAVKSVIEEYMEPKGFASEILLNRLNLLGHLNALYSSLQVTSVFSTVLILEFQKVNNWKKIMWFSKFENCLSDVLPHEYVNKFGLIIDKKLFVDDNVTIFTVSDYFHLIYKADHSIKTLISIDIIQDYAQIFSFLLKTRIALAALNRLGIKRVEENEKNILRLRRLCSIRFWLLHVMNTINFYFSTYSDVNFQQKMKELCLNERNLYPILKAHEEFVENWKHHCFVSTGHPCYENVLELISLISKLKLFFKMEQKGLLSDFNLDDFEQLYMDCMNNFASNLQLFEERLLDRNDTFSFLYDEVISNLPESPH